MCAASKNVATMIAGRAIQGAATGGIIVLVNVCISDLFTLRLVFIQPYFLYASD